MQYNMMDYMGKLRRILVALLSVTVLQVAFLVVAPTTHASTYVVPTSIDSTCATDVTVPLLNFIASVPDGQMSAGGAYPTVVVFPTNGCYRVEGTLEIVSRNWLRFDGNGSTFKATITAPEGLTWHQIRARAMWRVRLGRGISFTDMTVVGANPYAGTGDLAYNANYEAQHAWDVLGARNVDIGQVRASDVWGDFVYIGPSGRNPNGTVNGSEGVKVHDATFIRNGRQGVAIAAGKNFIVERINISQTRRATFDVEPTLPDWTISDVFIRDNKIGPGRLLMLAMAGAAAPIKNIQFDRNVLTGKAIGATIRNPTYCVPGSNCSTLRGLRQGIAIRDNTSDTSNGNPQGHLMGFYGADDVTVTGNFAPMQAGRNMYLAGFYDVCGQNNVSGNTVPNGDGELVVKVVCGVQ